LAVKIARQPKNIALLGAPTSAASLTAGHERGPQALRAAGLIARLTEAGFAVRDYGDCTTRVSAPDEEHPRARNVEQARAAVEELRPKIEVAVKSGALPLVLGGDDTIVLATVAGCRRYYRNVSLIDLDRDGGLNVPATTPSGCVDGMVLSHVIGRGAPELVRFWGEPPLVREPSVALFGVERLDEPEQRFLADSPLRRYFAADVRSKGAAAAAEEALDRGHGRTHEFVLHIDLDVISADDFSATNLSAPGGLRFDEVRQALAVFARQPTLAAIEVCAYNPALDPEGAAARRVIELLIEVLSPRLADGAAAEEPKKEAAPAPAAVSDAVATSAEKPLTQETTTTSTAPTSPEETAAPSAADSVTPGDAETPSS
jgi:arginase